MKGVMHKTSRNINNPSPINKINCFKALSFGRFPFLKKKGAGFSLQSFLKRKGFSLQSLTQNLQ